MSHQMSGISRKTFERDPKTLARVRTPAGRALALADERELAIRERALADAHRFVGVLLVCGMVLATLLASDSVSKDTALAVLSALLLVQLGSAPIAVALRTALPERG